MANTPISGLAAVTDLLTTDEFVLARSSVSKKITGADLASEIGGGAVELDYVTVASDITISGTTAAGATTLITGNSVSYDGSTRVEIEVYIPTIANGASGAVHVTLWEDSTDLTILCSVGSGTAMFYPGGKHSIFRTPAAGSHTYTLKAYRTVANGAFYAGSGRLPAYLRIIVA